MAKKKIIRKISYHCTLCGKTSNNKEHFNNCDKRCTEQLSDKIICMKGRGHTNEEHYFDDELSYIDFDSDEGVIMKRYVISWAVGVI